MGVPKWGPVAFLGADQGSVSNVLDDYMALAGKGRLNLDSSPDRKIQYGLVKLVTYIEDVPIDM